jgi:hypothetical protein
MDAMNPISSLLAGPTLDFTTRTVKAVAMPFELLLKAASQSAESTAEAGAAEESTDEQSLPQRVAQQLQQLLKSLGVQPGDRVTLGVDKGTGDVTAHDHPLAAEIEAAINGDDSLKADLQQLAKAEDVFDSSPFFGPAKVDVELAEDGESAELYWR